MAPKSLDEPPTPDEVAEVAARILGTGDEPEPAPAVVPAKQEDKPPGEASPAAATQQDPAPGPSYFEVDGRRYSPEDIRGLEQGNLRKEDFDRQFSDLKHEQSLMAERLDLLREREATERRLGKTADADDTAAEIEGLEGKDNRSNQRMEELEREVHSMRQRDAERERQEIARHAVGVFDRTFASELKKYEIQQDSVLGEVFREWVLGRNPAYIENGKLLSDEQIARNTAQEFAAVHTRWKKLDQFQRDNTIRDLKKAGERPAPPSPAGGPAPTARPVQGQEKRGMDPQRDAEEFTAHFARIQGGSQGD